MYFPVIYISYLFSVYFGTNYRTCGFTVLRPLFAPLRQNVFLLKLTPNSSTVALLSYFCVFLPPHFTVYTEGCCSPSLLLSNPVTESFVSSFPQIDPIAQVLLFCANITEAHFIMSVKSSRCSQSYILRGDRAISERALSRSERLVLGLKVG
jgi:hypothetical protein